MFTRKEFYWVLLSSILILVFSSIPYVSGYIAQTPNLVFSGAVIDRQDYSVHLATMHIGKRGEWLYKFRFSNEPQQGIYVKLGYIFLGHVARLLGTNLEFTYHLARWVFGISACFAIYALGAICFKQIYWRRVTYLLAVLGAGLGWLQFVLDWIPIARISPIDFWLIDAYVFFGILTFPHFAAVTALLVTMIVIGIRYSQKANWLIWLVTIFCGLCTQLIQPYAIILGDIAIGGVFIIKFWHYKKVPWWDFGYLVSIMISQIPLLYYTLSVMASDPLWQIFVNQNITLSPPLIYYVYGFGLLWIFALFGIFSFLRGFRERHEDVELSYHSVLGASFAWICLALMLAYLPSNLQRRFMHAYSVPLAILAVAGLRDVIFPFARLINNRWLRRRKNSIGVLMISMLSLSMILVVLSSVIYIFQTPRSLFDPKPLVEAVDWITKNAGSDDIVLSEELTGQLVASRSGLRVYLGHPIETLNYQQKLADIEEFFTRQSNMKQIRSTGVRWIIYGPSESEIGVLSHNRIQSYMKKVYQVGDVKVYEMTP